MTETATPGVDLTKTSGERLPLDLCAVPKIHRTALLAAARGERQRAMAAAMADGEAIRPADFYDTPTRCDRAQRSLVSLRERAESRGIIISAGPWGPRGGVRWQYNAAATEAVSTTDPKRLKDLILACYPDRRTDRHRDTLRAALRNPNVSAAFLLSLDLAHERDAGLRAIRVQNPAVPIEAVEAIRIPQISEDARFHFGIVGRLAQDPNSDTEHLLRTAHERDDIVYPADNPSMSDKREQDPLWAALAERGQAGDLRAAMGLKLLESEVFRGRPVEEFLEALGAAADD